jgi:D-hydroxyproline dehydrogenase subunit beta
MQEVRRKHEFYCSQRVKTEILDEKTLLEAEPNLGDGLAGGLRVPGDNVVYQLTAAKWFIDQPVERGGDMRTNSRAVGLNDEGVKLENGEFITAGNIVNAAGIGAPELTPGLPIRKRKGHLVITERYPGFVRHQLVELGYLKSAHGSDTESVAMNVQPRSTGQALLGSSRQFDIGHTAVDHKILRRMTQRAFEYMPKLRDLTASRIWTGFRPATPDNLPLIGRAPGFENVYVAAGHEGLGITSATGTAAVLTDIILGRKPAISAEPYSPARAFTEH